MNYHIRPLDFTQPEEAQVVASFSMLTILETLPEVRCQPSLIPNLDVAKMARMYEEGRDNMDHLYLVAVNTSGLLVGHAIALMRTDEQGVRHGYSYSRYVLPMHRRQGIACALLEQALAWWRSHDASYVLAHTHTSNIALQALFAHAGFQEVERTQKKWSSATLRLDIKGKPFRS